jgi:hypothetical protein
MMQRRFLALCVFIGLGGWGCSDGASAVGPTGGDDFPDLRPEGDTLPPLHAVRVLGMPEDLGSEDLYVECWWSEGDAAVLVPLFTEDGSVYLMTPLVDPEGASVSIVFTDGERRGPVRDIEILPLPEPRQGALEAAGEAMDALLRASTEAMGLAYPGTWEAYRDGNPGDVPVVHMPLFQAWHAMVDPQNAEGWGQQSFTGDERHLLERILATSPVIESIEEQATWVDEGNSLFGHAPSTTSVVQPVSGPDPATDEHSSEPAPTFGEVVPTGNPGDGVARHEEPGVPSITEAEPLALLLEQYRQATRLQRDLELFDETVGTYIKVVGMVLALAAGPGATAVAQGIRLKALEAMANLASAAGTVSTMARWFLPCCIPAMVVELDPPGGVIPHEDAEPNQVRLAAATGRAESVGVDFAREIADRVMQRLVSGSMSGAVTEIYGEAAADVINDYGVTPLFQEVLSTLPAFSDVVFVWPSIDLAGDEPQRWLDHEMDTFASFGRPILEQAPTSEDVYEFRLVTPNAFERQDSLIRFKTDPDELPADVAIHTVPVELRTINVEFEPRVARVSEEDIIIPFTVTIHNSVMNPAESPWIELPLDIHPPVGEVVGPESIVGNTLHFEYHPPDTFPPDTIVRIGTDSTAQGGIRASENHPPPRTGAMLITMERLHIDLHPATVCLSQGETHRFEALDHLTGEPVDVTWQASAGTITADGVYSAPGDQGEAIVTATATADPLATATARVILGTCDCLWSGRSSWSLPAVDGYADIHGGITLEYDADTQAFTGIRFFGEETTDHTRLSALLLRFDTPLPAHEEGPTVTTARFTSGSTFLDIPDAPDLSTGWLSGQVFTLQPFLPEMPDGSLPPPLASLQVRIDHRQGITGPGLPDHAVAMEGRVSGTVTQFDSDVSSPYFGLQLFADLNVAFAGVFTFIPPDGNLNCERP